jgi:hypothetical protein
MNKKARAAIIRKLVKAKRGKLWQPIVPVNPNREKPPEHGKFSRIDCQSFGLALSFRWGRREWLEKADPNPELKIAPKRTAKPSPLTKIAGKWQKEHYPRQAFTYSKRLAQNAIANVPALPS